MKVFIGIDPGINGGIACIVNGAAVAQKMPETPRDLWNALNVILPPDTYAFAVLEKVSSSPQMGVKSAFTFGNGVGHIQMALTAAGIPYEEITPQKWQKALGCLTGGNKNVSKRKAQELFPKLKITHAIADPLLIAEYARRQRTI